MDSCVEHVFVNKPFYNSFRKCTECRKRKIFSRIVKCSGCKMYCHRKCIQLNNNPCCRQSHVEQIVQVMELLDLEAVFTRSIEVRQELIKFLWPVEDDADNGELEIGTGLQDENNVAISDKVKELLDLKAVFTQYIEVRQEFMKLLWPEEDDADNGELETGTVLQDENNVAISDKAVPEICEHKKDVKTSDDVMPADDGDSTAFVKEDVLAVEASSTPSDAEMPNDDVSSTPLIKQDVLADEAVSKPSDVRLPTDESSKMLENLEELLAKPIQGCSALELLPYNSSSTETEMGVDKNDADEAEKNKCCTDGEENNKQGGDGYQVQVPGENNLD